MTFLLVFLSEMIIGQDLRKALTFFSPIIATFVIYILSFIKKRKTEREGRNIVETKQVQENSTAKRIIWALILTVIILMVSNIIFDSVLSELIKNDGYNSLHYGIINRIHNLIRISTPLIFIIIYITLWRNNK